MIKSLIKNGKPFPGNAERNKRGLGYKGTREMLAPGRVRELQIFEGNLERLSNNVCTLGTWLSTVAFFYRKNFILEELYESRGSRTIL
jgi:hypothetical protein